MASRGWSGFSLWGGSIAFDTSENWYFGLDSAALGGSQLDFYSVCTHELGHLLGFGTASEWFSLVGGSNFTGSHAEAVYGGAVPIDTTDTGHWADGLAYNGQRCAMDPVLNRGVRINWTALDQAALQDIGWVGSSPTGATVLISGTGNGMVHVYARGTDGNLADTGQSFTPFAGFTGAVRTAVADFNGDGVADYAFATGAGTAARVRMIDGATGADIVAPAQVLGGFGGGAFVAAGDVNGDGRAELVVSADAGGLPTVEVYQVTAGQLSPVTSFLAFGAGSTRGVRVAMGDLNRDGTADLIVGSGPGGLPRVTIYDGAALAGGHAERMGPPFLAFGRAMRKGVNVAVGDVNGDGYDDLIVSQDGGGSSKVRVWSGAVIAATPDTPVNQLPTYQQLFANGTTDRNGIRVVARDLNGDGKAEVVTSAASGNLNWVRVLSVSNTAVDALAPLLPFG